MKVYFCINDAGLDAYADHLRVAVLSARSIGGLEPHVLFDGDPERLRRRLADCSFELHTKRSSILQNIRETEEGPHWRRFVAEGALLRLEIPFVEETDDYVLYCDCDTIFTRAVDLERYRPRCLAAAPGHNPNEWDMICSGVLLMNVRNLRAEHANYMAYAAERLGRPHYYDQEVLNEYFAGRIERIPIEYHWKTYWGANPLAYIVHFHGLKRDHIAALKTDPAHREILIDTFRMILFENDGLDYYAEIFDLVRENKIQSARDIVRHKYPEIIRFLGRRTRKLLLDLLPANRRDASFNEELYLYSNPDVAIGVYNGAIRSGWAHYVAHGRREGRPGAQKADRSASITP